MARHDLAAVHPRRLHPPRRIAIAGHDLADQPLRQRHRHDVEALVRHRRGRIGRGDAAVDALHDLAPGMEDLPEHLAAVAMQHLRQLAIAGNAVVGRGHQAMSGVARRLMHARHLHDNESDAALRPRPVIGHERLVHDEVPRQQRIVAGREDAILDRDRADLERREEMGELRLGHEVALDGIAVPQLAVRLPLPSLTLQRDVA